MSLAESEIKSVEHASGVSHKFWEGRSDEE
jgi:hypothetical protein